MVKKAEDANVPVIGFNAGGDNWKQAGLMSYVGQDETVAGEAVGEKLNAEGIKSAVCVDQQQGAVQLEERCDGIKKSFKGNLVVLYVNGYDMATSLSPYRCEASAGSDRWLCRDTRRTFRTDSAHCRQHGQ